MITGNLDYPKRFKKKKQNLRGGRVKVEISKEKLEELYASKKLSCRKISKIFDCNKNQISKLLKEKGIKLRTRSEAS